MKTQSIILIGIFFLTIGKSIPGLCDELDANSLYELSLEELLNLQASSRLPDTLDTFPGSVTIIQEEEISLQSAVNSDLGSILSKTVPGFAPSTMTSTNRSTTLRGRKPAILIDGVPIDSPLHSGDQELRTIDASAIKSVEIIRGASALYGAGASGGSVNYITKKIDTRQETEFNTSTSLGSSLTHFNSSTHGSILQSAAGSTQNFGYLLSAFYENTSGNFDAEGDHVPSQAAGTASIGLAELQTVNLLGKLTYVWDEDKKWLTVSALSYDRSMDDKHEIINGDVIGREKTTDFRLESPPGTEDPGIDHKIINVVFNQTDVFKGTFKAQLFLQDYDNVFGYFIEDSALVRPVDMVGQTTISTDKVGAKLDFNTPILSKKGSLLWGFDSLQDKTKQALLPNSAFEYWVPQLTLSQVAPFVQVQFPLLDTRMFVSGGVRYERSEVEVKDASLPFGGQMNGGKISFDNTAFNAGFTYEYSQALELFLGFSEGYEIAEIGRAIRNRSDSFDFKSLDPRAVDNRSVETGVRFNANDLELSIAIYQSRSDLGLQLTGLAGSDVLKPQQSKENVKGLEIFSKYGLNQRFSFSGSFSWLEGKREEDGEKEYLNGQRIPPLKITASGDYRLGIDNLVRLQMLYSGDRDRFADELGSGAQFEGRVDSFVTFDLLGKYKIGPGDLTGAISNLFNKDYFTVYSQSSNRDQRMVKAPGRGISLRYALVY